MISERWTRIFFFMAGLPAFMCLGFVISMMVRGKPAPVTEDQRNAETMAHLRYEDTGDLVDELHGLKRGTFRLLRFKDGVERPIRIVLLDRGDDSVVIAYPDTDNPSINHIVKLKASRVAENTRPVSP